MSKKKSRHVWVVEVLQGDYWEPCSGCTTTKDWGKIILWRWKQALPDDKLRLKKYVRH
jgi:hypothetical protein